MKIVDYLLAMLAKNGVDTIFGNPGTTEIPLVRACERQQQIRYVVALSEVAAVPMADGYARAGRRLGVVNLHVAPGLGNGTGALYTAGIAGTPLLVLIGGQDRRFLHTHPILSGPLDQMARSVCKAVYGLNTRFDVAANVARALRSVTTPPFAPVALICPPDLLEEEIDAEPATVNAPSLAGLDSTSLDAYVQFLDSAKHPAIVAAEDVHWSDASAALEKLARAFAAPIYVAPYTGVLPVAAASSLYAGYLPPSFSQISERLRSHDALLFIGGRGLRTTLYSEANLPGRKAWLGADPNVLPADHEFELAYLSDLKRALSTLAGAGDPHAARDSKVWRPAMEVPPPAGAALHPTRAIVSLLERYRDAIWFDESGLSTSDVRQWMQCAAGEYLINGSGGIGWGLAASVGGALAQRTRKIVAAIGDGSSLYASEALWTGAHHDVDVLLVIFSNRRYATLNAAAQRLAGGALQSFTIEPPVLDFSGLATLYGWKYAAAASETELHALLADEDKLSGHVVLELKLDPALEPVTASRHF